METKWTWLGLTFMLSLPVPGRLCPSSCRCDETFAYCNDRGLTSIPQGLPANVSTLYLQNNVIRGDAPPAIAEGLPLVRTIYLYKNALEVFSLHLPTGVRELYLQENKIRAVAHRALSSLTHLQVLHLDGNTISAGAIESGAFYNLISLRELFMSRNYLSTVPTGLPTSLQELRLDSNWISAVPSSSLDGLSRLKHLNLDNNIISDRGIGEGAFVQLTNLTELSLARNSLRVPPHELPKELQKLLLQENELHFVPRTAFTGLTRLVLLDLSGNRLRGLAEETLSYLPKLRELIVRGNTWQCDCDLAWLHEMALIQSIVVRGPTCHRPEHLTGQGLIGLSREQLGCPRVTPLPMPRSSTSPACIQPDGSPCTGDSFHSDPRNTGLTMHLATMGNASIEVSWLGPTPNLFFRLSWVKVDVRGDKEPVEIAVPRGQNHYLLSGLEPASSYNICLLPLEVGGTPKGNGHICTEASTSGDKQQPSDNVPLPIAAFVGAAVTALLIVVVLLVACCCYARKHRWHRPHPEGHARRKDGDYVESGTKKDNSILEMSECMCQLTSLAEQPRIDVLTVPPAYASRTRGYKCAPRTELCSYGYADRGLLETTFFHT
uniref:leucine-rich repeat transmembrane protein FLRT3-like n=1 Tax=Myxine glutinosa TaxID=7769 RepID=UPI00358E538B